MDNLRWRRSGRNQVAPSLRRYGNCDKLTSTGLQVLHGRPLNLHRTHTVARDSEFLLLLFTVIQSTLSGAPLSRSGGYRLSPVLSPAPGEPARRHHGEAVAAVAQRPVQTRASPTKARPRAQEPRQSPATGEKETAKLELCSLVHPGPGALLPAPPLT